MPPTTSGTGTDMPSGLLQSNDVYTSQMQSNNVNQQNQAVGANTQVQTGNQLNQYTAGQQQLQQLLPGMLQGLLQGNQSLSAPFTAPQQVFDSYNRQFNHYVAPRIAAQFGAGSPQIASQMSQGNERLAANLYQSGMQNLQGFLNTGFSGAFNPIGQQTAQSNNTNWQNQQQQQTGQIGKEAGYQGPNPVAAGATLTIADLLNLVGV